MKSVIKIVSFILLVGVLLYISCKKEKSCENCRDANKPPISIAGPDRVITLPTDSVSLDGSSSSDPEGMISYLWTKISGPASFNILKASDSITKVKTLVVGTYQFELKVIDAEGLFSKDTMQVIVNAVGSNNLLPFSIAGNDTLIQTNQTSCTPVPISITLNGSNSYDADGSITSYLWNGPNGIANPNSAITTVSGLLTGTNTFILKVTDNNSAVGYDTVRITIIPANRPLVPAQFIHIGTLPQTRGGFSFAAAGNKIVFAGGSASEQQGCATARVDIYDISTGAWTIAQLSQARQDMGVAVLGNKIFFAGGIVPRVGPPYGCYITNGGDTRRSEIDIYDASTNTWSIAQLSNVRIPTGASAGNKVVFAGDDEYFTAGIDIYNAGSNSWSTSSLSAGRQIFQPAVAGNKIFFAGGSSGMWGASGGNLYKQIDIYDATSETWSVDSLSMVRGLNGAISANNKIYWGGGFVWDPAINDLNITNSVEIRDLATNTTSFDCLSEPKAMLTAVRKDNKIIFFGGVSFGASNERFDIYDLTTNSWSIGVLPQNLLNPSIISYNNILYVTGGSINGVWSNQLWKLEF